METDVVQFVAAHRHHRKTPVHPQLLHGAAHPAVADEDGDVGSPRDGKIRAVLGALEADHGKAEVLQFLAQPEAHLTEAHDDHVA